MLHENGTIPHTRILIVDDDERILFCLQRTLPLVAPHWAITFETDSRVALDLISDHAYDVLVADRAMPSVDGIALIEHARKLRDETVVFLMTGDSTHTDKTRFDGVLNKPFSISDLVSNISDALTHQRPATAA